MPKTGRIPEELYQQIIEVMARPCVDIVAKCNGEVLLLKRRIEPLKGFWALPGGMVNKGESLKDAVIRKIDEELGLKVVASDLHLAGVANFVHMFRHDICLTYVALFKEKPTEIILDYQHREYRWVSFNELGELGEEIDTMVLSQIGCGFGVKDSFSETCR